MSFNLKQAYNNEIRSALLNDLNLNNIHSVPYMRKVVLNIGLGKAVHDKKIIEKAIKLLSNISGQKAISTKAKKSNAAFKLREGMPIGVKVTLRDAKMYEFIERFINIALPRIRDFRGLSTKSFNKDGNFSYGVSDISIFPEVSIDDLDFQFGLSIDFDISSTSLEHSLSLLKSFNFPFKV